MFLGLTEGLSSMDGGYELESVNDEEAFGGHGMGGSDGFTSGGDAKGTE